MDNKVLLIRADAGTRIGTGHIMRCLALAQAWQRSGGEATFVMATESPVTESAYEQIVSLLMFHGMTEIDVNVVIDSVSKVTAKLFLVNKISKLPAY